MNLGNLINRKLIESKYENKKDLYEAVKDIIGDSCCAYNTFTEALNKNKSLSDIELLTLSVLLDIDLNKLALHYINSQMGGLKNLSVEEYLKENKEEILLYISNLMGSKYRNASSDKTILATVDKRIYFITFFNNYNSVVSYEIDIKKDSNGYLLKTNPIIDCSYFRKLIDRSDLNLDSFMKKDIHFQIEFLREEGKVLYELFPELKQSIDNIYLSEFEKELVKTLSDECFEEYSEDIIRLEDDKLINSEGDDYTEDNLDYYIERTSREKHLYLKGLMNLREDIFLSVKDKALDILPIWIGGEKGLLYYPKEDRYEETVMD